MTVAAAWSALTGLTRAAIRLTTILMTPTAATTVRSGVIPGGTPLALSMSGMVGTIAVGRAVVQGTLTQGAYPVAVTVAENFTVANGHVSLTRIDTVWIAVSDTDYDASGTRLGQIVYQQGTASGSPTAPTAPVGITAYLRLWDITVPAGASAGSVPTWVVSGYLADRRVYTVASGGVSPDAATVGTYAGQMRYNAGILEAYNGSSWFAINPTLPSSFVESTASATTTSTVWADASVLLSTTLVVPPSGRILVSGQSQMYQNTAAMSVYSSLQITGSTSGTIRAAADNTALRLINFNTGDNNIVPGTMAFRITGVPGETITAAWKHRVTGGGASADYRNITLQALAG